MKFKIKINCSDGYTHNYISYAESEQEIERKITQESDRLIQARNLRGCHWGKYEFLESDLFDEALTETPKKTNKDVLFLDTEECYLLTTIFNTYLENFEQEYSVLTGTKPKKELKLINKIKKFADNY